MAFAGSPQDAGHSSFQTTERYIRLATEIDGGEVFPPLPARLLDVTGREQPTWALEARFFR
jgi:hypothetical protein